MSEEYRTLYRLHSYYERFHFVIRLYFQPLEVYCVCVCVCVCVSCNPHPALFSLSFQQQRTNAEAQRIIYKQKTRSHDTFMTEEDWRGKIVPWFR